MKKFKDYARRFEIPTFEYHVTVIFGSDFNASINKRPKILGWVKGKIDNDVEALCVSRGNHATVFFRFNNRVDTFVHEAYHATEAMFKNAGVTIPYDPEVVAYHLGYFVRQILSVRKEIYEERKRERNRSAKG